MQRVRGESVEVAVSCLPRQNRQTDRQTRTVAHITRQPTEPTHSAPSPLPSLPSHDHLYRRRTEPGHRRTPDTP